MDVSSKIATYVPCITLKLLFPTEKDFQGRWGVDDASTFCHEVESDFHLFACAGYRDLLENIDQSLHVSIDTLSEHAKKLIRVKEGLETVHA